MLSPKSRKRDQKIKKNERRFAFSSFRLWPIYLSDIKMGSKFGQTRFLDESGNCLVQLGLKSKILLERILQINVM